MKTSAKIFIGIAVIGLLIAASYISVTNNQPVNNTTNQTLSNTTNQIVGKDLDDLAKHLTQIGVKMYGAASCHACAYQKELFGNSWQYINYVECGTTDGTGQAKVCQTAKIKAYPTWEFPDGKKVIGVMPLSELANKSSFKK